MRILVLSHMYPSAMNEVFGVFVHEQVKELVSQGCDVEVISPVPWSPSPVRLVSRKWEAYSQLPLEETWDGVNVYHPRYICFPKNVLQGSSGDLMHHGIRRLAARIHGRLPFDLIHAHTALPDGYAAMLLSRAHDVPLVVTVHGVDVCTAPSKPIVERSKKCRAAELRVFHYAYRTVGVSTRIEDLIKAYSGGDARVATIHNGVPGSRIAVHQRGMMGTGGKVLLSVGSLIPRKGQEFVIRALPRVLEEFPGLRYVVVGEGEDEGRLRRLSSRLGVSEHVEFLGRRGQDEVYGLMEKADVFVLPSWAEAFGVVYLEAMAVGTPVIGCKGQGLEDVVIDGESGLLVEPRDTESLGRALNVLLGDRDLARRIGERGRQRVDGLTWSANARNYINLYEQAVREWEDAGERDGAR